MIAGAYKPTGGEIWLNGTNVTFKDASDARAHGVEVVYQDLALVDLQPVYMNLFLGRELVSGPLRLLDRREMARQTQTLVDALDVRIPSAKASMRDLSGGQRQGVAICRATHWASSLVLMDEPTAVARRRRDRQGRILDRSTPRPRRGGAPRLPQHRPSRPPRRSRRRAAPRRSSRCAPDRRDQSQRPRGDDHGRGVNPQHSSKKHPVHEPMERKQP